ncbi:MAG TPA: hypothetical protein VNJ46_06600 [Gaiellaceae bacterium]|nr:hypothetical protein [Gaiellaceae bacterium]
MSGWAAVLAVAALETAAGIGVLAALGVAGTPVEVARRLGLAPLAGMALAGVLGALLAFAGARLGLPGLVALAAGALALGGARLARRPRGTSPTRRPGRPGARELAVLAVAAATILAVWVAAIAGIRDRPLAEWDGWAMWGMKARALALLGADPAVFASPAYAHLHLEYPLLLPALHSLPLQAAEGYQSNTVLLSCLAIGLAGIAALWTGLAGRVRPVLLLPFLAAYVAAPAFFVQLATGYADVPLAVFLSVGVACAARWLARDRSAWLALATLFLAAAALSKNEGLLFAAAAYTGLLAAGSGRRRAVLASAGAVALACLPWRVFVEVHDLEAPDYRLADSLRLGWVLGRLDRAWTAGQELVDAAVEPRRFGLLLALGVGAVAVAAALGARRLALFGGTFFALSSAGLLWVYVLTPYDLRYYLFTNAERVIVAPIFALAALAPLLVEETVRRLRAEELVAGRR